MSTTTAPRCPHLDELPQIPATDELTKLRRNGWKKRRKSPHPKIDFAEGRLEQRHFKLEVVGSDYRVIFSQEGGQGFTALLSELCNQSEHSGDRLRFGWLVADVLQHEAQHLIDDIPGPNEAMEASAPYLNQVYDWRRWAVG
jgi:hypothetical protein